MNINARYFGMITYEEEDVVTIPDGLFGFEHFTRFLPLPFEKDTDSMISFQSLEDEDLAFILMNPFRLFPDYAPALSPADLKQLGDPNEEDISYYVISVIRENVADSTLNLKAPLAINAPKRQGKQVILEHNYPFRQPLADTTKMKEG